MAVQLIKINEWLRDFSSDQSGATAIEYALIGVGISTAIIVGFEAYGDSMGVMFTFIEAHVVAAITS